MRATFKLSDYGGTAPVHIYVGGSGKQYTFLNKRDGHGYRIEFDGSDRDYEMLMRDLLSARHPYHSCFVYFPAGDDGFVAALRQTITSLQADNESLTTSNQALVADVSELRMILDDKQYTANQATPKAEKPAKKPAPVSKTAKPPAAKKKSGA